MAVLPLDRFLCWKLKVATYVIAIYLIATCGIAALMEILDVAAWADDSFEISGGFKSYWRSHVWEGWLACNLVMLFCDLFIIGCSIIMIVAILRFPTYYEFQLMKGYYVVLIMYILISLGIAIYKYSWYGPNTYRLPFLVFSFLYWLTHTLMNITCVLVLYSRIAEIYYEIEYGEKKTLSTYSSQAQFLEMRSGYSTPRYGGQYSLASQSFA